MSAGSRVTTSVAAGLTLLLALAAPVFCCGPFFLRAIFTYSLHPDFPLEDYAGGRLGIVQPTYARSYLVVAYRYLTGVPLNAGEQSAAVAMWKHRLQLDAIPEAGGDWLKQWLAARQRVPGAAAPPNYGWNAQPYGVIRAVSTTNRYQAYPNCLSDAFRSAAATLEQRIAEFGAPSEPVRGWLAAQDAVFANCVAPEAQAGPSIPPPAPPGANPLVQADRAYQIAAAYFYAGDLDEAQRRFEAIMRDPFSPWSRVGSLMAARTLIRKATLPDKMEEAQLRLAEQRLRGILAAPYLRELHASAERLLSFVLFRLNPRDRLQQLARALAQPNAAAFGHDLSDYTLLLDSPAGGMPARDPARQDDLTDWTLSFQSAAPAGLDHALEKWQRTKSPAWLVASITKMPAGHAQQAAVLDAAAALPAGSPAFPAVAFHAARLQAQAGRAEAARATLDRAFASRNLPPATRNLLLALRMKLARNLDEFLAAAARTPATISLDVDGNELPDSSRQPLPLFDADAAQALTEKLPLPALIASVKSGALPAPLRRQVAIAAWVRAVILGQDGSAKELIPALEQLVPELKPELAAYAKAPDAAARRFTAALLMLRVPGLRPYVVQGVGRETPVARLDNFRDNWWCAPRLPGKDEFRMLPPGLSEMLQTGGPLKVLYPGGKVDSPGFLTAAQKEEAEKEWQRISTCGTGPNYLAAQVLEWAKAHPDDARVPEALHLAVRATRYGCTDKDTPRVSKAAFDLLHRRYPRSPWAEKTKYRY